MICPNCGSEISDIAVVCPNCGTPTGVQNNGTFQGEDKAETGMIILAIFVPIVGLILGITENGKGKKNAAKKYFITAGLAFAFWFVCGCCCGFSPAILGAMSDMSVMLPIL